jgi:DNA-directed RNA polymerase subunit RPC12/RpoP
MVTAMKGRTTCPECKKEFILDLPKDDKKHQVACPECGNKFDVFAKYDKTSKGEECTWEEHGEPRKTILSATKPKTNKPMIAAMILICVFAIGIATSVFSEEFIKSTLDIAANAGLKGDMEIFLTNQTSLTIENATITWNGQTIPYKQNGVYYKANIKPGVQIIEIKTAGYKTQRAEILVTPFFKSESKIKLEEGDGQADEIYFDNIGCSIIIAIFTVFVLFAMIACLKRQYVDVAIAGAFLGIFSFGFFFIGSILSIIAFVLIIMSRDEFRDASK